MLSIKEMRTRLPKEFMEILYEKYTPLKVDEILLGMTEERFTTLRVNTLKYDIQSLMRYFKEKNIKFERVLWYNDALIIKNANEKQIQKLDLFEKGYIYLQSLSSMIPPLVLTPKRGEKIGDNYQEKFDKILLDTPCSGEGRFIVNRLATYRDWSIKKVKELSKLQIKLFESAYKSLKPGGSMVYSTCTINEEENEKIIDWATNNLKLVNINLQLKNFEKIYDKAIKILPSKEMEGFFVAKLYQGTKKIDR